MFLYEEITGSRYKYRLRHSYCHELSFTVDDVYGNEWCGLFPRRALIIENMYCWDGVSFPLFPQTPRTARASLVHDALCQLSSLGYVTRLQADKEFKKILLEDGMNKFTAEIMFHAVRAYALIKYN